jgi:hypothetical protein
MPPPLPYPMHKSCLYSTLTLTHFLPIPHTTPSSSPACTTVLYLRMSCLSVSLAVSQLWCCVYVHVLSLCHVSVLSRLRGLPMLSGWYLRDCCVDAGFVWMTGLHRGKGCARGRNVP